MPHAHKRRQAQQNRMFYWMNKYWPKCNELNKYVKVRMTSKNFDFVPAHRRCLRRERWKNTRLKYITSPKNDRFNLLTVTGCHVELTMQTSREISRIFHHKSNKCFFVLNNKSGNHHVYVNKSIHFEINSLFTLFTFRMRSCLLCWNARFDSNI